MSKLTLFARKGLANTGRDNSASNIGAGSKAWVRSEGLDEDSARIWEQVPPTRNGLTKLREKARRCGTWFRRLKKDERDYVELVIKVVEEVRSPLVKLMVARILKKLLVAMRSFGVDISHMAKTVGRSLAYKLSQIAQAWGNKSAVQWQRDRNFIRYLTIMYLNQTKRLA